MQKQTLVHERIALAKQGKNPYLIGRMQSGWLVLGDDQRLPGYTLLLHDPIVAQLNILSATERALFLQDMTIVGDALYQLLSPALVNYSILGNVEQALHAHIHPRYNTEEPDKRKTSALVYRWLNIAPIPFDYERDRELIEKIKMEIIIQGGTIE